MPDETKPERSEKKNPYRVRFRFRDDDGTVWTVWDATYSNVRYHLRAHSDPTATVRIFVNEKGEKRSYTFHKGESRVLEVQALERQSREASVVAENPDTNSRTPW